jgi:hypothetical protein
MLFSKNFCAIFLLIELSVLGNPIPKKNKKIDIIIVSDITNNIVIKKMKKLKSESF